jgi:hypothetical protein
MNLEEASFQSIRRRFSRRVALLTVSRVIPTS